MKYLKLKWLKKQIYLPLILTTLLITCDLEVVHPDYVGRWAVLDSISEGGISERVKYTLTFTDSCFTNLLQYPSNGYWVDFKKTCGIFKVNEHIMKIKVTEYGNSTMNMETGVPTGMITMYKSGSVEFETMYILTNQLTSFESTFNVSGRKMTLMTDWNDDGDFTDLDETIIYTKQ